ncbi:MAG TPA: preprotein translocase subunit SecG [Clostridia bacterium]|nr:preprotein translocase subunit SecG [Clostridia bacterium]
MQAIKAICTIFLVLSALVVIVTVLLQSGERTGLGVIAGGAETFFGKNKAKSYEGKLALATKVSAGVFIVMSLIIATIQG